MASATKDFTDANVAASRALEMIKSSSVTPDDSNKAVLDQNKTAALSERAESLRLIVLLSDKSKAGDAITAYQEYIAALTDPVAKSKAQFYAAEVMFEAAAFKANNLKGPEDNLAAIESFKQAIAEYQHVLETQPDNPDALAKIGLSNIQIGYLSNPPDDKMLQEGANYLQKFVDKAPETHPLKSDAMVQIQALKSMNIQPQKVQPAKATNRRRP